NRRRSYSCDDRVVQPNLSYRYRQMWPRTKMAMDRYGTTTQTRMFTVLEGSSVGVSDIPWMVSMRFIAGLRRAGAAAAAVDTGRARPVPRGDPVRRAGRRPPAQGPPEEQV